MNEGTSALGRTFTNLRRYVLVLTKGLVSVTLLSVVLARVDFASLSTHWSALSIIGVVTCLGLLALQITVIAGTRLKLVLECLHCNVGLPRTSRVALSGFFFEQVAFGFVGGDAMRLWLLHRMGAPPRKVFTALIVDRLLGLLGLLLLVAAGLPGLVHLLPHFDGRKLLALTGVAAFALAGTTFAFRFVVPTRVRCHPLSSEIRQFLSLAPRDGYIRRRVLLVLGFAIVTQLLNVLIMFIVGKNIGLPVNFAQWFAIVPAALLFSMVPVSAGGWGLREGVLVFGLQGLGARPEEAIVPSIVFGLGMLVVTLPGAMIWLSTRRSAPRRSQLRIAPSTLEEEAAGVAPGEHPVMTARTTFDPRP
jgi:uncharacterized membrane protein YbhN (UPF0104 family)